MSNVGPWDSSMMGLVMVRVKKEEREVCPVCHGSGVEGWYGLDVCRRCGGRCSVPKNPRRS